MINIATDIKYIEKNGSLFIKLVNPYGDEYLMPRGGDINIYLSQGFTIFKDELKQVEPIKEEIVEQKTRKYQKKDK